MTPSEREQQAREWLISRGFCHKTLYAIPPYKLDVDSLVALIAEFEAATLERVADEMERHPYWSKLADVWIKHLRQQAKEIHP